MSKKVFQPNEDVKIDAEYMERWLGGVKIHSLSPKTLFDLQTLLSHYRDIIVPMDNVKVSFPVEGFDTACASVDEKKIFIPTQVLQEGKIDETIGLVIHELNHIKHSEKESTLLKVCANFIMVCLDSIFVETSVEGEYLSLKEIVYQGGFNFAHIQQGYPQTPMEEFFSMCIKDVMLLLNSVEDIRIDAICPHNLKKYIDKIDTNSFENFKEHYENGALDDESLMNIVYRMLYHHKGFIHDPTISKRYGDTEYIKSSLPKTYVPTLLKSFKNEIKEHCEEIYNSFSPSQPQGKSQTDEYLTLMETSSNEESFNKMLGEDKSFSDECVEGVEFEDSELDPNSNLENRKTEYQKQEEDNRELAEMPSYMEASINVFKNVDVVDCSEQFTDRYGDTNQINYKTLLIG